jgi:hypothetical protein
VKYSPKTPSVKNPRHAGKKYKGQSTKDSAVSALSFPC